MTEFSLNQLCSQGAFLNGYVFHICGMPWAATNSPELKDILDAGDATADELRKQMFGRPSTTHDTWNEVQVLEILTSELGEQQISYDASKGIDVSSWSVRIENNPSGFVWKNAAKFEQWGVVGLDWQPTLTVKGSASAVLGLDFTPSLTTNNGTITFAANKGGSLYNWLDDNWGGSSYTESAYIYMASSCLRPTAAPVDNLDGSYSVAVSAGHFNSPVEDVRKIVDRQSIYMTNYPQAIAGLTANLYGVGMDARNNLITGTTPVFMRSGKVKNNATVSDTGMWTVNIGGFTDQLKFRANSGRFSGYVQGYEFNTNDLTQLPDLESNSRPHIVVREYLSAGGYNNATLYVGAGAYESYNSIAELVSDIAADMDTSTSLSATYYNNGSDIAWEGTGIDHVAVQGPAAYVAGLGFIRARSMENFVYRLTDPINNNIGAPLSTYVTTSLIGEALQGLPQSVGFSYSPQSPVLLLRKYDQTDSEFVEYASDESEWNDGIVKNRATLDYYVQFDYDQVTAPQDINNVQYALEYQASRPVPQNKAGNRRITVIRDADAEIGLTSGDILQFGEWGTDEAPMGMWGIVSTYTNNEVTFFSNEVRAFPWSMYSCSDFFNLLRTDKAYYDEVQQALGRWTNVTVNQLLEMDKGDMFKPQDSTHTRVEDPIDILKQLIGDQFSEAFISDAIIQTSIKNVVERGDSYNYRPFVDWDTLDQLLTDNKIPGAQFTFSRKNSRDVDWLGMLNGLCMTHGIQMTWEYTPTYKCWWMSFKLFGDGNASSAQTSGRLIAEDDIADNTASAIAGGEWLYSRINADYTAIDGSSVPMDYALLDGRTGHMLKDRALSIKDNMTLLPINDPASVDVIIDRYSTMLQMFSTVRHNQRLSLNMRKSALLGVGRWSSVSWEPLLNQLVGRRDGEDMIGEISSMNINLSNATIDVQLVIDSTKKLAISGSLNSSDGAISKSGNVVTFSGLSKDPSDNKYAATDGGLTDLATFGCFDYYDGTVQPRNCGCAGYRVTVFERNPVGEKLYFDPSYTFASLNVWRGTMEVVQLSDVTGSGTASIDVTLDGGGSLFDISNDYVILFSDRADSDLQPCQTQYYGWLGDQNNEVTLSDASKQSAILVKS
jgi:hypothetical protein